MSFDFASIWSVTSRRETVYPSLREPVSADVAIIGGGISGLTCAYLLAEAGKNVVVLEASEIGSGTTGRSTGNLYVTVDQWLSGLKSKWGREKASHIVFSRASAIDFIEKTAAQLKTDCGFRRVPFHYFTEKVTKENSHRFEDELQTAHELNVPAQIMNSLTVPFKMERALQLANQAQFHPLRYVRGLAQMISARVRIFENSPVVDYDLHSRTLTCRGRQIKADRIVFATHVPIGTWGLQMRLSPIREHGVAVLYKGTEVPGTFWCADTPKRSVRMLTADGRTYVMTIGKKFKTGHYPDNEKENEILLKYLNDRFPLGEEKYWWGAQSYSSADEIPFIGEFHEGCYALTGFSSDGLVYGTLGAQIVADEILKRENPWAELYRPERKTYFKSAAVMSKEGVENFCEYLKDLPKTGTVSADEIARGQGGIVEKNGEKIAVFRDEQNALHAVSAVCTHMKCIVTFNSAEKTWDCPCHASRFRTDGTVIEGPAMNPLEGKTL